MKVTWSQMDIPLISGLAAALYLQSVLPGSIPETIEEQASFYHRFYDNSTSAHDIYGKANAIHFKSMYYRMYRSFEYVGDVSEKRRGYLTPLSTIFQLYRGDQF